MKKRFYFINVIPDLARSRQLISALKVEKKIRKLLKSFEKLNLIEVNKNIFLNVSLVSASEIKKLNKKYRKKNSVTDVLSFEQDKKHQPKEQFFLGDLVLCLDQAKKQAKEQKQSLETEIDVLLCHGILHLLGYDHEKSKAKALEMSVLERKILQKTGLIGRN